MENEFIERGSGADTLCVRNGVLRLIGKEELKSYFDGTKDTLDGGFDLICPCHNAHHPSGHIKMGRKGYIGRCKTCGASLPDMAKAKGIKMRDLFIDAAPYSENRVSKWQFYYEKNCIDKYPYFGINTGLQTYLKYRMKPLDNGKKHISQSKVRSTKDER